MNGLAERAERVIPGGCFGYTRLPDELAFIATHGVGSHLFSTEGHDFLDYTLGSGPLLLGHAHPSVTKAIAEQAARGTHFYAMNETSIELAEFIVRAVPSAEAIKFCADGSQATFFAMRLARAFTARETIMKFNGAYHGHHDYALPGFPGQPAQHGAVGVGYEGIPVGATENVVTADYNDLESARMVARSHRGDLAAIIVEPVQRALTPAPGFLQGLRDLADELGALLIFDEVVTGFRLSRGGAQELYGVRPDLTALGKAIGGGTAVGAFTGSRELIDLIVPQGSAGKQRVFMSGTLNGNPLGAAAGLALLKELDAVDAPRKIASHVSLLTNGLRELAAGKNIELSTVGPGQFFDVVFGAGEVTNLASYVKTDREAAFRFGVELLRRGIYVVPGGKFYVSTEHTEADAEIYLRAASEALDVVVNNHSVTK